MPRIKMNTDKNTENVSGVTKNIRPQMIDTIPEKISHPQPSTLPLFARTANTISMMPKATKNTPTTE